MSIPRSLFKGRRLAYALVAVLLVGATFVYAFSGTSIIDRILPGSSTVSAQESGDDDSDGPDSPNSPGSSDSPDSPNSPGSPDSPEN